MVLGALAGPLRGQGFPSRPFRVVPCRVPESFPATRCVAAGNRQGTGPGCPTDLSRPPRWGKRRADLSHRAAQPGGRWTEAGRPGPSGGRARHAVRTAGEPAGAPQARSARLRSPAQGGRRGGSAGAGAASFRPDGHTLRLHPGLRKQLLRELEIRAPEGASGPGPAPPQPQAACYERNGASRRCI